MQITESIVAQISRKTFNQMFDPALRRSKVLMSGNGSSVNWADNAGHANSADSLTDLSQIENMLADYVSDTELETTLASYATKTWVDQNYLSISFFNALFQARTSQGAAVAPNSGDTTTIDNIKAMFGFWTDQYLSALGQGSDGGGPVTTLAQLNDVQLSLPLADGEVLTYSTTLGKWTNGAGVSTAWANITGKPTTIAGYGITDAHITNGVITLGANSITPITSLSGYATESWVNTQLGSYVTTTALGTTLADYVTTTALGTTLADYVTTTTLATTLADYATKTYVDQNYLSLSFFNALFQARTSAGVTVAPNNGDTTTIDNIKALFGFWTDQYISALGQGADGGGYTLNEPLSSINNSALGTPSQANVAIVWNGTAWTYGTTMSSISWSDVTNKPTTLAGYGITDALPLSGGTISGGINPNADSTINLGTATAKYHYIYAHRLIRLQSIAKGDTYDSYKLDLPDKSGIIAVTSDIPTNNNQLTNGAGYITGITSSMVTSALGYTPANNSSLSNYLPLSGGSLSGALNIKADAGYYHYNTSGNTLYMYIGHDARGFVYLYNSQANTYIKFFDNYNCEINTNLTASSFVKSGGTSSQFLKADGSVDSNTYALSSSLSSYLPLSGGTMTGSILAGTNNSYNIGSTTAKFHYGYIHRLFGVQSIENSLDGTYRLTLPSKSGTIAVTSDLGDYLPLVGGTLTGPLLFNNNAAIYQSYNGAYKMYVGWSQNDSMVWGYNFTGNISWRLYDSGAISLNAAASTLDMQTDGRTVLTSSNHDCLILNTTSSSDYSLLIFQRNGTPVGWIGYTPYNTTCITGTGLDFNVSHTNGYVGINTTSPSYRLHVVGDIYATGGVTALSDIRKKDVIAYKLPLTVDQIAAAPTIKFTWKDKREEGEQAGTIAQYWQNVLPWVIKDKSGELSMQYGVAALISSITIARKVVDHEQRITELERECERLRFENEQLKLKIA